MSHNSAVIVSGLYMTHFGAIVCLSGRVPTNIPPKDCHYDADPRERDLEDHLPKLPKTPHEFCVCLSFVVALAFSYKAN